MNAHSLFRSMAFSGGLQPPDHHYEIDLTRFPANIAGLKARSAQCALIEVSLTPALDVADSAEPE
ncbi:hypothetical protein NH00_24480 [Enterobacter cancerogenus]|jgi:hypothetical protein|nr:hypothetical protein NH00_24480 [Enterobacter cancerogenus]